jgi:hypothetical protein
MDLEDMFAQLKAERDDGKGKAKKAAAPAKGKAANANHVRKKNGSRAGAGAPERPAPDAPDRQERPGVRAAPALVPSAPSGEDRLGEKGIRPPPFVPNVRTPDQWPKKHEPGSLKTGDSVWYGEERWWIVNAPPTWEPTSFVCVSDQALRPNAAIPSGVKVQMVHADLLELAPTKRGPLLSSAQPTKHAIETRERMKKEGLTDIGDVVAEKLRNKTLDEAYAIAAEFVKIPENELRAKYVKLNPGQQRMNLGNRMRGWLKKHGS